jgi:hypothetical protein
MESKWFVILAIAMFGMPLVGIVSFESIKQHDQNQCKIVAMQKGLTADDTLKVCVK